MDSQITEIVVQGTLGPEFMAALPDYAFSTGRGGRTRIVGPVADQARLFGILDMLEQFHIEVISVNPVGSE